MTPKIYVNGRFLTQTPSGVQRFATEITASLLRESSDQVAVLSPMGIHNSILPAKAVGKRHGHVWEQLELPRHVSDGILINLGNTAPLRQRRQIIVIHDAGVHTTPEAYDWKFRLWYKFMQNRLVAGGTLAVTVSEFSRRELCRSLGVHRDTIAVITEGADHMHAITPDIEILKKIPPGRFALVVGNLAAHKNLSALSLLAAQLAARDVRLVISGGLVAGAFRAGAADSLPQPACYVGRVSDGALKALYQAATCLVFPSTYEGFGLPAVEAMACGCPVAASDIPALREVCGKAAMFFDPFSPSDIATQVCRLVDDRAIEAQCRAAGSNQVLQFTWARAASHLLEIVSSYHKTDVQSGIIASDSRLGPKREQESGT